RKDRAFQSSPVCPFRRFVPDDGFGQSPEVPHAGNGSQRSRPEDYRHGLAARVRPALMLCCAGMKRLLLLLALAPAASAQATITLHAARLLDVESGRIAAPGEILVRGDRIVEAGSSVAHPPGAQVIDLGDRTLMPGLIDAHIHLFLHPGAEDLQTVEES